MPETPPNTPDPADLSPAPAAHVLNAELHTEEAETPNPSETMAPPAEQEGPVVEDHTAGGHRTPDVIIYHDADEVGGAELLYEFKCYPPLAVRHDRAAREAHGETPVATLGRLVTEQAETIAFYQGRVAALEGRLTTAAAVARMTTAVAPSTTHTAPPTLIDTEHGDEGVLGHMY